MAHYDGAVEGAASSTVPAPKPPPTLAEQVQELRRNVESHETLIEKLGSHIDTLESRLAEVEKQVGIGS